VQFAPHLYEIRPFFARRIVGWRVSTAMATQFVLDALEQAIWQRKTPDNKELIHHSDRGSQYLSIKYTERLIEVGIDPSVGTVGDSYDMDLSRICAAPGSRLSHLPFKSDRAFPAQC
jgi:transposase InsO family protein